MNKIITRLNVLLVILAVSAGFRIHAVQYPTLSVGYPFSYYWYQKWTLETEYITYPAGITLPTSNCYQRTFDINLQTSVTNRSFVTDLIAGPVYHQRSHLSEYQNPGCVPMRLTEVYDTSPPTGEVFTFYSNVPISEVDAHPRFYFGSSSWTSYFIPENYQSTVSLQEFCYIRLPYKGGIPGKTYWYRIYMTVFEEAVTVNTVPNGQTTTIGWVPASSIHFAAFPQSSVVDASDISPGLCYLLVPLPATSAQSHIDITPSTYGGYHLCSVAYGSFVLDHISDTVPQQ